MKPLVPDMPYDLCKVTASSFSEQNIFSDTLEYLCRHACECLVAHQELLAGASMPNICTCHIDHSARDYS